MIAIAIDGPSGAGKSTIARTLAKEFGFTYMDTGALYRAIGLFALRHGADPADAAAVVPLLDGMALELRHAPDGQHVLLCGEDVTDAVRAPEVAMAASGVSAIGAVREYLVELQRGIARERDVIMDGRDIGTVILPRAQIKLFLTASSEDRARRRYEEMLAKGQKADYQTVLSEVKARDTRDSTRDVAPLAAAPDAITVDTTGNTFEESLQLLRVLIGNKLRQL